MKAPILRSMLVASINGILGVGLSFWVGIRVLGWEVPTVILCLVAAQIAALVGALTILRAERVAWVKKSFLRGSILTWGFLTLFYAAILLGLAPMLRDVRALEWMAVPLLFSNGLSAAPFGWAQDWVVRRDQRRQQQQRRTA